MPFVERQGQPRLHYRIDDYTDSWANAPYVWLQHGFGRSSQFWYKWIPYLSRHYRVIRPDLRGIGESSDDFDLATGISVESYLGDMVAIMDHIGADKVHYCGESMGGILGLALAGTLPERVKSLSVVSTPVHISRRGADTLFAFEYPTVIDALRALGSRTWAERANLSLRFPEGSDPAMMAWYADAMGQSKTEVLIAMQPFVEEIDTAPYLSKITAPVLGIYPTGGTITGTIETVLQERIQNVRIVRLPTKYHSIAFSHAAACARQVLAFAATLDGKSFSER